jgi:hypothetical protein
MWILLPPLFLVAADLQCILLTFLLRLVLLANACSSTCRRNMCRLLERPVAVLMLRQLMHMLRGRSRK